MPPSHGLHRRSTPAISSTAMSETANGAGSRSELSQVMNVPSLVAVVMVVGAAVISALL